MLLTFFVVAVLALVQSLFGVGLLVFGTPTLLLLGYSFAEALVALLPASIAISLLQIWMRRLPEPGFVREFVIYCLIPVVLGLSLVLVFDIGVSFNIVVAMMLFAFAGLRISPRIASRARNLIVQSPRKSLVLIGAVHGLSNLGGALLTIYAAACHHQKEDIRALVAFCYSWFAAVQLCILAIFAPHLFSWDQLKFAALSATVFVLVGQRVFSWLSVPIFDRLLTIFIIAYAGLLAGRSIGLP